MPPQSPIVTEERPANASARPDPARGVFETVLALDGGVVELDAHLERLSASVSSLYGIAVPADARRLLTEAAAGLRLGRVRLTLTPVTGRARCEVSAAEVDAALYFPPAERATTLITTCLPGGLGAHKWNDRSMLPASAETTPLVFEPSGEVLEAGRANVFALRDDTLTTPPLDGRILPGITRAAVIALARGEGLEVREQRLDCADLLAADGVLLTGSVRGIEAARALDGQPLRLPGEILGRLGELLRERWRTG